MYHAGQQASPRKLHEDLVGHPQQLLRWVLDGRADEQGVAQSGPGAAASRLDHGAPGRIQAYHQVVRMGEGGAVDEATVTGSDVDRDSRKAGSVWAERTQPLAL